MVEEKLVASKWCFFRWFFILGHGCFTMLNAKRRLRRLVVSPSSLVIFRVSPSQRIQHFLQCSASSQGNTCILSFLKYQVSACAAIYPEDSHHRCQGWYLTLAGPIWAAFLVALVAQWQIFGPLTGRWDHHESEIGSVWKQAWYVVFDVFLKFAMGDAWGVQTKKQGEIEAIQV